MTDVVIHQLTKRFGDVTAVDGLSLTARSGQVTGFIGPNGSGKTTTLRILLGLASATSGTATIGGRPYAELSRPAQVVGAVLGTDAFHPTRTGRNHLKVQAAVNVVRRSRVDEVLDQVGLTHAADRAVKGYSLGMRQRLALATAMLTDPEVLVLDEPANGLDPDGIRWLRGLLRGLAEDGRTVLVSSHALAELSRTADEVALVSHGRLVTQAPLGELLDAHPGELVVRTPRAEYLAAALSLHGGRSRITGDTLTVDGISRDVLARVASEHGVPVVVLEDRERDLENVYFDLVSGHGTPSARTDESERHERTVR